MTCENASPCQESWNQLFAGLDSERIAMLQSSIELVPKGVLDVDTLVAANFEWLLASKSGHDIGRFFGEWRRRGFPLISAAAATCRHLDARRSPAGTEAWASLPLLTLAAALELTRKGRRADDARDLLWAATDFAPRLVARDLVLATVLRAFEARKDDE